MYLNADQLTPGTTLRDFDLCIVGAGAAGIAMAKRLIGSSLKVLLLAGGHASDRGLPDPRQQSIYKGRNGDLLEKMDPIFLERSRLHMYGGTTNHFGFWARTLDEGDLQPRPGYRDAHWPFGLAELLPYYADANFFGNFGPCNFDDLDFWGRVLFARCFPSLPADPLKGGIMHSQPNEELHDFQLRFGGEMRAASNITVLFNAHLLNIASTDSKDHVTRLDCSTIEDGQPGRRFHVEAAAYVLAMGGIESVRALQLSGDLGNNARDQLGRGFMIHPLITHAARVRFAQPVPPEVRNFFRDQQVRLQAPALPGGQYIPINSPVVNPEVIASFRVFNAWGVLVPTQQTMDAEKIGNFRIIPIFDYENDQTLLNLNWEQIPNENSRITLDPDRADPVFGQPVANLDLRLLPEDKRTAVRALELCRQYLEKRGGVDFRLTTDLSGGPDHWSFIPDEGALTTGDHHMGALRMSAQPADGIVNPDSRLHAVDNLYATGCAVFPTGGWANPTLTLVALALRLADHLKEVI